MHSTLVLNASTEPLNIIPARNAVKLILNEKAVSVDNSPRFMRSAETEVPIPYVIWLKQYVNKKYETKVPFSRRGILVRDGFVCVYCGSKATTIDHVLPSSKGGTTSWENCVAACLKCNGKKADKTLTAMGWSINFTPKSPSPYKVLLNRCAKGSELWTAWTPHIDLWS